MSSLAQEWNRFCDDRRREVDEAGGQITPDEVARITSLARSRRPVARRAEWERVSWWSAAVSAALAIAVVLFLDRMEAPAVDEPVSMTDLWLPGDLP